ncbi:MAG: DCC1-like thiol-disulfide oxidoreductase family protein [Spirosomataceae bacterium]
MKTCKTIIYDDTCPLCTWYTKQFVRVGALEQRLPFSQLTAEQLTLLDIQRARHEIPLIDTQTGHVYYGLEALTLLLSRVFPQAKKILQSQWVRVWFGPLYQFVSYNRRIIVPPAATCKGFNAAPDFHAGWRLRLIAFFLLITAGIHHWVAQWLLNHHLLTLDGLTLYRWSFWLTVLITSLAILKRSVQQSLDGLAQVMFSLALSSLVMMVLLVIVLIFNGLNTTIEVVLLLTWIIIFWKIVRQRLNSLSK